jgi:hypothetical protein
MVKLLNHESDLLRNRYGDIYEKGTITIDEAKKLHQQQE